MEDGGWRHAGGWEVEEETRGAPSRQAHGTGGVEGNVS